MMDPVIEKHIRKQDEHSQRALDIMKQIETGLNTLMEQTDWSKPAPEYVDLAIPLDSPVSRVTFTAEMSPELVEAIKDK